jgi:hypothetical protein
MNLMFGSVLLLQLGREEMIELVVYQVDSATVTKSKRPL